MNSAAQALLVFAAALLLASGANAQFGSVSAASILNGTNNVPSSNTESTGTFTVALTDIQGSFTLSVSNIVNLTQVHLHQGSPTTADGKVILVLIPVLPYPMTINGTISTQGNFNASALEGSLAGKQLVDLANAINTNDVYINAHTGTQDGTTFIRGQVTVSSIGTESSAAAPAPAVSLPTRRRLLNE